MIRRVQAAVDEAYAAGHLGKDIHGSGYDLDVVVHAGAGAYICGEETALLEGLEGRRGQPRLRPPFPAVAGLYASPTVINNVESIASVPSIIEHGAAWFASMGTEKSKGYGIFSLSGHVTRPGQYEAPLGITLRELIDLAGGMREGHMLKFWTPGGSSTPLLTAEHLDVPLGFEEVVAAGSMLGTRALQLFDETTCVVRSVLRWTEFYKHESCGKCTPCREGTWWLVQTLTRLEQGIGQESDLDLMLDQCDNIFGRSFCALADGAVSPIQSSIKYFRDEYLQHLAEGGCPFDPARSTLFAEELDAGMTTAPEKADASVPDTVKTVSLTIDGIQLSVPENTLVIRAAEQVGVQIPRFCDHPLLAPVGACRQCLVDIPDAGNGRGFPKPQASCTLPVAEGMVVNTQVTSEVADKAQQGIMEFLLINHPLDCPVCDKGGECPLQNQAMSNGRGESRFFESGGLKRTFPKPINISAQVLLDRERCVLCARCTRFSAQIAGDPFIELLERGALQQVGIYEQEPYDSYFSGNAIQICPVGALTSAEYRFRSRPFDLVSTPSIAEHDACGSAIRVDHRRGKVMRRLSGNDPEVNEEWITDKDRFAFHYASAGDRLTYPQVRDRVEDGGDGELRPASWTEAFAVAARGLAAAAADGRGVGVLPGGRITAEDGYAYAKFARAALGTNDIDFRARPLSAEEASFLAAHVVLTGPGNGAATYADLERANTVVLAGFEPEDEAGAVFLRLRKANHGSGTKVVSIAPYSSRGLRKMGGTLIPTAPGDEAAALDALGMTGDHPLDSTSVIMVGERLATSPGALSSALGLASRTGARLAWVPRRAGDRGAIETGCLPHLLPGGRPVADAQARVDVATTWGLETLPESPGRDADQIVAAVNAGELGGLVVGGVDPDDTADPAAFRAALDAASFVVALELRETDVTRAADVVFPVAAAVDKAGIFVTWEGRPRWFDAVFTNPQALPDSRVLAGIAEELGGRPLGFRTVAEVRAQMEDLGPWDGDRATHDPVVPTSPTSGGARRPRPRHLEAAARQRLDAGRRRQPARHRPQRGRQGQPGRLRLVRRHRDADR